MRRTRRRRDGVARHRAGARVRPSPGRRTAVRAACSSRGPAPSGPEWSGTSKLKYAYRLSGVGTGGRGTAIPGPLDSAWWWSTGRPGIVAESVGDMPLSSEEGRWLALLTWDPRPWSRALAATNVTSPGDPATTASRLCDPAPLPRRACAFGVDAVRIDSSHVELRDDTTTTTLPTRMTWATREHFGVITARRRDRPRCGARLDGAPGRGGGDPRARRPRRGARRGRRRVRVAGLRRCARPDRDDAAVRQLPSRRWSMRRSPSSCCRGTAIRWATSCSAATSRTPTPSTSPPMASTSRACASSTSAAAGCVLVESVAPANVRELQFSTAGVRIDLPFPVRAVRLDVLSGTGSAVVVTATAADGSVVDTARCPGERRRTLVLASRSLITAVTLTGGGGEGELISICVVDPVLPDPDDTPDDSTADESFPLVFGTRVDGPTVRWVPTVVATIDLGGIDCSVVRYDPPTAGRTWRAAEILPWIGGRIGVVSTCGSAASPSRSSTTRRSTSPTSSTCGTSGPPPARPSGATCSPPTPPTSSVSRGSTRSGSPPRTRRPLRRPIPTAGIDGDDVVWEFRTAAGVEADALPAVPDTRDESIFDPRAVARYLLGTEPAGGDATTHFRDDPLLVHFSVDHLEALLSLYGRELAFTVQRTDPPPGSAGRYGSVARPARLSRARRIRLGASDARFAAAVAAAAVRRTAGVRRHHRRARRRRDPRATRPLRPAPQRRGERPRCVRGRPRGGHQLRGLAVRLAA